LSQQNIFPDGRGDNKNILHHEPDLLPQPVRVKPAQIHPIKGDGPAGGVVEAFQEIDEGGFSGTGRTHNRQGFTGMDRHRQIFYNQPVRLVGEIDATEGNLALNSFQHHRLVRTRHGVPHFQQVKDPFRRGHGGLDHGVLLREFPHRLKEEPHISDEGCQNTDGHVFLQDFPAPVPDDQGKGNGAQHLDEWHKNPENPDLM